MCIFSNCKQCLFLLNNYSNKKQEHVFINSSFTDVFESVNSIYVINEHNTLHNVQPEIHKCIILKGRNSELNYIASVDNSLNFNGKKRIKANGKYNIY